MHRRRSVVVVHGSLEAVFGATVCAHWPQLEVAQPVLRPGLRYCRRDGRVAHHGRLIDSQRPVMLVLRELITAPFPMLRVHCRYRFEPEAEHTRLIVELKLRLFPPGRLTPWVWLERAAEDNRRRLARIRLLAEAVRPAGPARA